MPGYAGRQAREAAGPDSGAEGHRFLRRRMAMPNWVKPVVWGAVLGSVLTMIVGFSYGGWTTSSTAARLAKQQADTAGTTPPGPPRAAPSKGARARVEKMGGVKGPPASYDPQEVWTK